MSCGRPHALTTSAPDIPRITRRQAIAATFSSLDSGCLLINATTRFPDGLHGAVRTISLMRSATVGTFSVVSSTVLLRLTCWIDLAMDPLRDSGHDRDRKSTRLNSS